MNVSPDPHHAFTASLLTEVTMKSYYILSAIGKDRPGIVASVSQVLYRNRYNIEALSQNAIMGQFAMILIASRNTS